MKKICILPVLLLFVLTVQAQTVIKGDVNNDKVVSLLDVIETSNAILGKPSANYNATNADVNGDKKVNAADIVSILNIIIANKQTAPTKADLIGSWEVKALDESSETFSITITDSKFSKTQGGEVQYEVPYTYENGTLTYTVPATEWSEAYTETRSVSLLCDKSALVMKYKPEEWETDEGLEEAEVYINKVKQPDTSGANLDGKWFCHHGGHSEVRTGLWINGNTAEFIIGAWSTRMVGTYTYSHGILTLKPDAYYSGRSEDGSGFGYGNIDPETLECSQWYQIENPGFPETFVFILNGNEAYSWYAMPLLQAITKAFLCNIFIINYNNYEEDFTPVCVCSIYNKHFCQRRLA